MNRHLVALIAMSLAATACARAVPEPWNGPVLAENRSALTVAELRSGELSKLLDMSFFARPGWATMAAPFAGIVTFTEAPLTWSGRQRAPYAGEELFPAFSLGFTAERGVLIPATRRKIETRASGDSFWDIFVGAGAVWREAGDEGWSRASFPVSLVDRYIGQTRNCVGTFVYAKEMISNVALQCSQETANLEAGDLANIRAMLPVSFTPGSVDTDTIVAEHRRLVAGRLPVAPLSAIDRRNAIADYFNKPAWTNAATTYGAVLVDGTLYQNPPMTRHGLYPYPEEIRLGVFSVSKSMSGALSLFYFAERYGEEIFDEKISDWVPQLAETEAWQDVTFSHALNMVSGTPAGEQRQLLEVPLVLAADADTAIANIAGLGDWPEEPGEKFVYGSTNTFVLSYALQNYVESKEGAGVKYWDLVRENVLEPIGAGDYETMETREAPATRVPYLAYGASPTPDSAAKIAMLFANEGRHDGKQILARQRVREALGKTDWRGYETPEFWSKHYRHSFWETPVRIGLFCRVDVPFMLGYGANYVLFPPSGVVIFRFMDEQAMDIAPLVRRVDEVRSSCD